jgi:hypothetical protein
VALLTGCSASRPIYSEAIPLYVGTENAHLSTGFTSEKINRTVDYQGRVDGDEVHFVTFGSHSLKKVPHDHEGLLAVYRATELALSRQFKCIEIFHETKFKSSFQALEGGSTHSFQGNASSSGTISGTISQNGPLDINLDRGTFGTKARWGRGIYAVMKNSCADIKQGPAIFSLSNAFNTSTYVHSELRYLSIELNNELHQLLQTYLK